MTSETEAPAAATPSDAALPLDEVMLAMDVVDVLRHQQSIVEAELGEDERERALVRRIREIYESQGIDVPEAIVAQGVDALRQDRFTYKPPERTFQVRVAEVYVARGWWAKRAALVLAVVLVAWGTLTWVRHRERRALVDAFAARRTEVVRQLYDAEAGLRVGEQGLARAGGAEASGAVAAILDQARALLADARGRLAAPGRVLDGPELDPEAYPEARERLDARLAEQGRAVADVLVDAGRISGLLASVERLRSLRGEVDRVIARLAGVTPTEAEGREIDLARRRIDAALEAGDDEAAAAGLRDLDAGVTRLLEARRLRLSLEMDLVRAEAALQEVAGDPAARQDLDTLLARARGALAADDLESTRAALSDLFRRVERRREVERERRALGAVVEAGTAELEGIEVEPRAREELTALGARLRGALDAGDVELARNQAAAHRDMVEVLKQAYTLRIVSRPDERSGVWRYPVGGGGRNYYIIVEAVDAAGRVVPLDVTSEEDQSRRRVRQFGIRVTEQVFERVKADKTDNGIVDDDVFGVKRRGALEPEYRFPVAGGRITGW